VIIAELHQCMILSIGLSDAADQRRVNNDRLAGLQFGELMERDISTDLNSIEQVFDKLKERFASLRRKIRREFRRQYTAELATRFAKDQIGAGTQHDRHGMRTMPCANRDFGSGNRTMTFDALPALPQCPGMRLPSR
jgi:hypothetical protein